MASRSNEYIMHSLTNADKNIKHSDSKKTALRHSMRINLDPLLMLEKSLFEQIPVLLFKEGKA
jgi:hypothetical protein